MTQEQKLERRKRLVESRKNRRDKINARKRKYTSEHREEIRERSRKRISENHDEHRQKVKERRAKDENYRERRRIRIACKNRIRSYRLAKRLGLKGEIHHCFGVIEDSFIVLSHKDHMRIHFKFGPKNEDCSWYKIAHFIRDNNIKYTAVINGKIQQNLL